MAKINVGEEQLNDLLREYAGHKQDFDSLKKVCDRENSQIKDLMAGLNLDEAQVDDWIAKRQVQTRETLNSDRLLELVRKKLPKNIQSQLIRTQEYVDLDRLEDAIYTNTIPAEFLLDMDTCREIKTVVTLRMSKVKKKKGEDE